MAQMGGSKAQMVKLSIQFRTKYIYSITSKRSSVVLSDMPARDEDAQKLDWSEIQKEVEDLWKLHDDSIADFKKCRKFNARLSDLLMRLEDMECYRLADRVMDILGSCNPKEGSHCENSLLTKSMLDRLRERVRSDPEGCR